MITAGDFIAKLKHIADDVNTVYGNGMVGRPITEANVNAMAKYYPSWYTEKRKTEFRELYGKHYFGFDCVCLIKAVLWGWNGNESDTLGGAKYLSNDVDDLTVNGMLRNCTDVSDDFSTIVPGELLWLDGHVGVYIGDNRAIECTLNSTKTRNGVIYSAVKNLTSATDLYSRKWDKHGKMRWIDYTNTLDYKSAIDSIVSILRKEGLI